LPPESSLTSFRSLILQLTTKIQMKKNLLLTCALAALFCTGALAEGNQTVTLNGTTVDKTVSKITFSGNSIKLLFTDGTEMTTEDAEQLKIAFSVVDAIRSLSTERQMDSVLVFDAQGKLLSNVRGNAANDCLNGLPKGIYIAKKGSKTVKLIKN
jgi:hypothetical protein